MTSWTGTASTSMGAGWQRRWTIAPLRCWGRLCADRLRPRLDQGPGRLPGGPACRVGGRGVGARLDRLGRSLPDALRTVQELTERGIGLKALDVELDTSTAAGRLMLKMLLVLADWERDLLRERTREGVARARAAGKRPGPRP